VKIVNLQYSCRPLTQNIHPFHTGYPISAVSLFCAISQRRIYLSCRLRQDGSYLDDLELRCTPRQRRKNFADHVGNGKSEYKFL